MSNNQFQAAQNLVVLSREAAGAEQIFRNDGVKLIHKLLQSKKEDIVLSALRTLVGLCTGHQSRVSATVSHKLTPYIIFKAPFFDRDLNLFSFLEHMDKEEAIPLLVVVCSLFFVSSNVCISTFTNRS